MSAPQVEFVCMSGAVPLICEGRVQEKGEDDLVINLAATGEGIAQGARAIVNFSDNSPRMIVDVTAVDGNQVRCTRVMERPKEQRDYPRLAAGVPVALRLVRGVGIDALVDDWVAGSDAARSQGEWHEPDEFMNFSVSGLCFDTHLDCKSGDLVLIHMGIRDQPKRWNCTARVVRVDPVETDASEQDRWSVAVCFEFVPKDAQEALTDMTLDIQEALF